MRRVDWVEELSRRLSARGETDPRLAAHRLALLALLEKDGVRAFERDSFEPGHVTASAFTLDPEGGRLLLIQHRKLRLWLQPGGHVEPDDVDWSAAALRELEEETGLVDVEVLDPLFDVDVHSIPAFGATPAHLHHDVRVLLRARDPRVAQRDEVDDIGWFSLEELATTKGPLRNGLPTDESVRRVAERFLKSRLGP